MKLTSAYAEDQSIAINGQCATAAPEVAEATEVEMTSFVANWKAVESAESYLLTVKDITNLVIGEYEDFNVGDVQSFLVTGLQPASKYTYSVKTVVDGISSAASDIAEATTLEGSIINYSNVSEFIQGVNTIDTKNLRVVGTKLTDKITVEKTGSEYFTIDATEISAEGGSIKVTYHPLEAGNHTAQLTLKSAPAQDVVVELSGKSLPAATTAKEATEITNTSFIANWEVNDASLTYRLVISDGNSTVKEQDFASTTTSYLAENLTPGTTYNYVVYTVANEQASNASNKITVTTHAAPQPVTTAENSQSIRVDWPAVVNADSYWISLYEGTGTEALPEYNQVKTTETGYSFTGLKKNTTYSYQVASLFGSTTYISDKIEATTIGDYGDQVKNSDFELWDNEGSKSIEPRGWNSFMNAEGSVSGFAKDQQVNKSGNKRPGSTGSSSAVIWSRDAMGFAIANGNMTTGKIMANSSNAADETNYNISLTETEDFSAKLGSLPDTLSVWVKYVPKSNGSEARISAAVHDKYDYLDPSGSDPEAVNHLIAKAERNYSPTSDNGWQRLSIPFVKTEKKLSPEYILISFTTNKSAGGGSENDSVYVDDMLMIYTPTLKIDKLSKTKFIPGDYISVPYTLTGSMSVSNINAEPNVVSLEISDETGSFNSTTTLTSIVTDQSGVLTAIIPDDLPLGNNYRIRVRTTNYAMTSAPYESAIEIREVPAAPEAFAATNVSPASFVANWSVVPDATGYIITVNGKSTIVNDGKASSYEIKGLNSETKYVYTVQATRDELVSEPSNSVDVRTTDGGLISFEGETTITTSANKPAETTLQITGTGLFQAIGSLLEGSELFTIKSSDLGISGGEIVIEYSPVELGKHSATLTLRSMLADDLVIQLEGLCSPAVPNLLDAKNVTPFSFEAQWEAAENAESYLLTVSDENGNILDGYGDINTEGATSLVISGLTPVTTYNYFVKSVAQDISSNASEQKTVTTVEKPSIANDFEVKEFLADTGSSDSDKITVTGTNLLGEGKITISLIGSEQFSVDKSSVSNGEEVTITFQPQTAGADSVTVSLNAEYADGVEFKVYGTARPQAPVALPAQDVTFTSFTARWEAVEGAEKYLLTVKDNKGTAIKGYDHQDVGTALSAPISDLFKLRDYSYTVEVIVNKITSLPSNEIEVLTMPTEGDGVEEYTTGSVNVYPNPAEDQLFINGIESGKEYMIISSQGSMVQQGIYKDGAITVDKLEAGTYILKIDNASLLFIKK